MFAIYWSLIASSLIVLNIVIAIFMKNQESFLSIKKANVKTTK